MNSLKRIVGIFIEKVNREIARLQLALLKEYENGKKDSKNKEKISLILKLLENLDADLSGVVYYEKAREILDDFGDKYECMTMNKIVLLDVTPETRRDLHKLFAMDINCVTEDDLKFYN